MDFELKKEHNLQSLYEMFGVDSVPIPPCPLKGGGEIELQSHQNKAVIGVILSWGVNIAGDQPATGFQSG